MRCYANHMWRWLQVARTPQALTLHLKRFRFIGRRVTKLDAHVPFESTLDLSPFSCNATPPVAHFKDWRSGVLATEEPLSLYGVVEHLGTFDSGHYIAFVRLGERRFRMNDSVVREVDEAVVYKAQAFLLFYERRVGA